MPQPLFATRNTGCSGRCAMWNRANIGCIHMMGSGDAHPSAPPSDIGVDPRQRFQIELEFVQCLGSPAYLNWLAQNRFLDDPAFLRFLAYLQYWRRPEYCAFVTYPNCLQFLDLLQAPEFRTAIANPNYKELVHTQQFYNWQHWRKRGQAAAATAQPPAAACGEGGG